MELSRPKRRRAGRANGRVRATGRTPRRARLLGGQPQIAWEIAADNGGRQFRVWIPAAVPPGLVECALASAWPGITTTVIARDEHAAIEREAV
jgi:hypothetical protein